MFRQLIILLVKWLRRFNPVDHFLHTFPEPDFNFRGYFYEATVQKLNFQDAAGIEYSLT